MKLDDKKLEEMLKSLPQFQMSKKADKMFYAKLNTFVKENFEEEEAPPARSFFAFPRLAFVKVASFGRINSLASLRLGLVGAFASLLLVVGGTVWAYQPSTTRGKLMYPWKQTAEKVELAFAFSNLQKVDAHLKFSDRRLEEAQNIIGKSSSLAFLLKTAFADEGEVELSKEEQKNLEETLEDMRDEVTKASEIVETRLTAPEKAQKAIERIKTASNKHIETLNNLERRAAKEAKELVRLVADNEDERLAALIPAHEEIKQALEKRERQVKLIINVRRERLSELKHQFNDEIRQRRIEMVKEQFSQAMQSFNAMPQTIQQEFANEMEKAKAGLEMGRFGMAQGLSRTIEMRIKFQPMPLQTGPEPNVDGQEFQPQPLPGADDKQFNPLPSDKQLQPGKFDLQQLPADQKQPDVKSPEPKNPEEKPIDFLKPSQSEGQPKPTLIDKIEPKDQPQQIPQKPSVQPETQFASQPQQPQPQPQPKPQIQQPQGAPMPFPSMPVLDKGMDRVENLIRGLQEAGGNFEESK